MAWTTPRTWVASEVPTATIMNAHIRDNMEYTLHTLAYKTVDETVNNSATYQNDDELFFTVGTSQIWYLDILVAHQGDTTADWNLQFTWPSGTGTFQGVWPNATTSNMDNHNWVASGAVAGALPEGYSNESFPEVHGVLRTAGAGGTFQVQWAQATATAVNTTIKAGSRIAGCRLA